MVSRTSDVRFGDLPGVSGEKETLIPFTPSGSQPKDQLVEAKQRAAQLLAIISLIAGGLLGTVTAWHLILVAAYSMRGRAIDFWYPLIQAWLLGLAAYLISVGLRRIRGTREGGTKTPRIGWGRVLVGTFLILSCVNNLLHPVHSRFELKPSNETQAAAMKGTELFLNLFMPFVGAALIILGIRARFKKPIEDDASYRVAH
jgi:hypothetical protein